MFKELVSPILGKMDSETWHVRTKKTLGMMENSPLALQALELIIHGGKRFSSQRLIVNMAGIKLDNPLLVAAGWDKTGEAVKALFVMGAAGVEVGSVLEHSQEGNPKPRQWVIGNGVVVNRLGFNSPGMYEVASNLEAYIDGCIPIGVSIGKNKEISESDAPRAHANVARYLYKFASYFTLNVSSPNTPGLRALQEKDPLRENVIAVNEAMDNAGGRKPFFVKIAPDLSLEAIDDVARVCIDESLSGIVVGNTTINLGIKSKYGQRWVKEAGGLSGDDSDYRAMINQRINFVYRNAGDRLVVVGVGGICKTKYALDAITSGASVLQINSGIRGEGPRVFYKINQGLDQYMIRNGVGNVSELVGTGPKLF